MKKKLMLGVLMVAMLFFSSCSNLLDGNAENNIVWENEEKKEFVRGVWNERTYTNEFSDFEVVIPEEWVVATDKEVATLMGLSEDLVGEDGKFTEEWANEKVIYDTMAQNIYTGSNVTIMFDNLSKAIGGTIIDENKYLDILKTQLGATGEENRVTGEMGEIKIGEHTYYTLGTELPDLKIKQMYYVRKVENYMACILTTAVGDEELESIIK